METIKGNAVRIVNYLMQVEDKMNKQYELKEVVKKRTLTQNSYVWELMSKLANEMRISKEEVYFEMLKAYGQVAIIPLREDVPVEMYFKHYEEYKRTTDTHGVNYIYYKVFAGSSEYDTKQMGVFIDGICQECEQLGIETMTPEEIAMLKL